MRRKRSLFSWFRRDQRAPNAQQNTERKRQRRLWAVIAALAVVLGVVLTLQPTTAIDVVLGSPSPRTFIAERPLVFESTLLTDQARTRAESDPNTIVYNRDVTALSTQRRQLQELLQTITQIRDDASLNNDQKLQNLATLPNSTVAFSETLATQVAALSNDDWQNVSTETLDLYDRAVRESRYEITEDNLRPLRDMSLPYWASASLRDDQRDLALLFAGSFLKPNVTVDQNATLQRKQQARDSVAPITVTVQRGESIVREGEIVTPQIEERLVAFGKLQPRADWAGIGGRSLLVLVLSLMFGVYLQISQQQVWQTTRPLITVAGLLVATLVCARLLLASNLGTIWPTIFPLAAAVLLLAALFNTPLALVAAAVLCVLIGFVADRQFDVIVTLFISSFAGAFVLGRADRSLRFLAAGAAVALASALLLTAFWLVTLGEHRIEQWWPIMLISGLNGALSAVLALGLYNLLGTIAGIATPFQLMELAHPAQPLLRKLIRDAPGTYYHSVAVGNLAESAAEAIGADALLLRVAAYYHDIGKSLRPYFFTDNQSDRGNVHNELDPRTSAQIIAGHVREGFALARDSGLPEQVRDFIPTHHGTSVIKHFYQIALQQEDSVRIEDFRYPGPKPQTREQAILMLADSVEATVRSKAQNGKLASSGNGNGKGSQLQTLEELVNSIIDERVRSGQLDESPLTLHDLSRIREAFIGTLQGIYHPRVDYAPQLVKT